MADLPHAPFRLSDLATAKPTPVSVTPNAAECTAIAAHLGLTGLRKVRFEGSLAPVGDKDWQLSAHLGATVVQDCVITLAPVTTRIEDPVTRLYLADLDEPDAAEVEMPSDETAELLPTTLDLAAVMIEALSLALPDFPKADGADLGQAVFAEPGATPMTDEDSKPFAGLQSLRDKLQGDAPEGDG